MISHIPTPASISLKERKDNTTEIVIEPCYPGYGVTLGNALRRVLLSSLPGAAVVAVKIKGIHHEYDTIEYVKEDMVEIIMNLKKLRLKCHSTEPVTVELTAKGEKEVTAADIKKNADVEVVSKDLVIATLTDKKAELSMELTVRNGRGYEPVEDRVVDKKDIGSIQIDAIFSPLRNVGFTVEHVRVGQRTDYEKIILQMVTDGSISAREALEYSIETLQEQLGAIVGSMSSEDAPVEKTDKKEKSKDKEEKGTKARAKDSEAESEKE